MMQDTKDLGTTGEAADVLECSTENVRRLARTHRLKVTQVVGRGVRLFNMDDVRRLADERSRTRSRGRG